MQSLARFAANASGYVVTQNARADFWPRCQRFPVRSASAAIPADEPTQLQRQRLHGVVLWNHQNRTGNDNLPIL